jgi:hypothetical protein
MSAVGESSLDVQAMLARRPELLRDALDRSLAYPSERTRPDGRGYD